ncbi:unnamed protein product [Chrysoparadoxa australica]
MLRHVATKFACYIFMRKLSEELELPDPGQSFFNSVWTVCSGGTSTSALGRDVASYFDAFSRATGIQELAITHSSAQLRKYQANDLAASTKTAFGLDVCMARMLSVVKWDMVLFLGRPQGSFTFCKEFRTDRYNLAKFVLDSVMGREAAFPTTQRLQQRRTSAEIRLHVDRLIARERLHLPGGVRSVVARIRTLYDMDRRFELQGHRDSYRLARTSSLQFGADGSDAYRNSMRQLWCHDAAPPRDKAPLPLASTYGACFLRYDTKALRELNLQPEADAWWYKVVIDPFSKQRPDCEVHGCTMKAVAASWGDFERFWNGQDDGHLPWFVGKTFQTDGFTLDLCLQTGVSGHPFSPGLSKIQEKGYFSSAKFNGWKDFDEIVGGVGMYHRNLIRGDIPDGTKILGVDPGEAKVVDVCSAVTPVVDMRQLLHHEFDVPAAEYKTWLGSDERERRETSRRQGTAYGASLGNLEMQQKRTSRLDTFTAYCTAWRESCAAIFAEMTSTVRSRARFNRYQRQQRTIELIVARFRSSLPERHIVFFGDGNWATKKFSCPRKKLIKALAEHLLVVIVPEAWTSSKCFGCNRYSILVDGEHRVYRCQTSIGGSTCPLHPNSETLDLDRDVFGRGGIAKEGLRLGV